MKILLIDDDVGSLHGMQLALRMLRHLCDAYTNPVEAVENYAATSYDLVITDIYMPQLDGFMLADEIHAVNPAANIVFMSGAAAEVMGVKREWFMEKPIEFTALKNMLDRLGRRCPIASV